MDLAAGWPGSVHDATVLARSALYTHTRRYRFIDLAAGWPGSVHDATVVGTIYTHTHAEPGQLLPNTTDTIAGVEGGTLVILGDAAYLILP